MPLANASIGWFGIRLSIDAPTIACVLKIIALLLTRAAALQMRGWVAYPSNAFRAIIVVPDSYRTSS